MELEDWIDYGTKRRFKRNFENDREGRMVGVASSVMQYDDVAIFHASENPLVKFRATAALWRQYLFWEFTLFFPLCRVANIFPR